MIETEKKHEGIETVVPAWKWGDVLFFREGLGLIEAESNDLVNCELSSI